MMKDDSISRTDIGKLGEDAALVFLEKRGLVLRDKNWKMGRKEVDIIMEEDNLIHFIEVRTRKAPSLIPPYETINRVKQNNILYVAANYLRIHRIKKEAVFGIVSVEIAGGRVLKIEYFSDAFNARWR